MEKPIRVGDLVVMVRGHECVLARRGGIPFVVLGIESPRSGGYMRPHCNTYSLSPAEKSAVWKKRANGDIAVLPLSYLKRIPPADELETERTDDEVTA